MEFINLKSLNLTIEESSRDVINYITQKRGISAKKLLSTIKPNLKRENNKILTTKTQQKLTKLANTQKNLIKTPKKSNKNTKKSNKNKNTTKIT